ncbi:MAG: hypothetical protein IJS65_01770 [Clostridia bacterium]|nr:hypothetical protein [Clostridia bacterium]
MAGKSPFGGRMDFNLDGKIDVFDDIEDFIAFQEFTRKGGGSGGKAFPGGPGRGEPGVPADLSSPFPDPPDKVTLEYVRERKRAYVIEFILAAVFSVALGVGLSLPAAVCFFVAKDNPTGLLIAFAALFGGIYVFWKYVLRYAILSVKGARGAYEKAKAKARDEKQE